MKFAQSSRQRGLSSVKVVLILGVLAVVVVLFRRQMVAPFTSAPRRIQVNAYVSSDPQRPQQDRYIVLLKFYHEATSPLNGRLIVKAEGSGQFRGFTPSDGQDGVNQDEHTVIFNTSNWEQGESHARYCIFDLHGSRLNENGLTQDQVEQRILVKIEAAFFAPTDNAYQGSFITMTIGQGSPD